MDSLVEASPGSTGRRGKLSLLRGSFAGGRQARLLGTLDLSHPAVMNDKLNHAEAQAFNFFANKNDPIRDRRRSRQG